MGARTHHWPGASERMDMKYIGGKYTRGTGEIKTREIGYGQAHSECSPTSFGVSRSVWREPGSVVSVTPLTYEISLTALCPRWPGT